MGGPKGTRAERHRLKQAHPQLFRDILEILNRHDPIGLVGIGAPDDEYEPEAGTILARLDEARSAGELERIVHEEFVSWFSEEIAGPRSRYEEAAREVWRAWETSGRNADA